MDRQRYPRRCVDGVLLLDKPAGLSSTQAMAKAKRLFRAEKAGHTGTLDPFATGLLPICFGEATKFARFMLDAKKAYRATLRLGATSSTGDTEGEITPHTPFERTELEVRTTLHTFLGIRMQRPPMHSAVKQDGVPLYRLARRGVEVDRPMRQVNIQSLELVSLEDTVLIVDTLVSKGTYIRVLAEEIGAALGCGAYLTGLRRTATGGFALSNAMTFEALDNVPADAHDALLLPPPHLCSSLPNLVLDEGDTRIFTHGGWVGLSANLPEDEYAVESDKGQFLGVGRISGPSLMPRLIPVRLMTQS